MLTTSLNLLSLPILTLATLLSLNCVAVVVVGDVRRVLQFLSAKHQLGGEAVVVGPAVDVVGVGFRYGLPESVATDVATHARAGDDDFGYDDGAGVGTVGVVALSEQSTTNQSTFAPLLNPFCFYCSFCRQISLLCLLNNTLTQTLTHQINVLTQSQESLTSWPLNY